MLQALSEQQSGGEFEVEITYSRDKFWSHWNTYQHLEIARHEVDKLKAVSPEGFNARIVRKEIVQ